MYKMNAQFTILSKTKRQSPERTTAIPPARIAVLIQPRNNTESTRPTKPNKPKMVKAEAGGKTVQHVVGIYFPASGS